MAQRHKRTSIRIRTEDEKLAVHMIRAGCRVTIVDARGKEHTGRAVMKGPAGWVLNMGGRHGTPAIASEDNVTRVSCGRKK